MPRRQQPLLLNSLIAHSFPSLVLIRRTVVTRDAYCEYHLFMDSLQLYVLRVTPLCHACYPTPAKLLRHTLLMHGLCDDKVNTKAQMDE